ncbi:MAG: isoprenylcysteine carboxylmethyltransferase family protein [bacterium]|nr:isoprenylcysteine carboxylmethyltransferase family protein [bacterium]
MKLAAFLSSVFVYFAFLCVIAYLWAFTRDVAQVRSLAPGPSSTAARLIIDLGLATLFGVLHTVMTRRAFQRRCADAMPRGLGRSTCMAASCATLVLSLTLWQPLADPVWEASTVPLQVGLHMLATAGALLAVSASFQIDHWELFGVAPAWRRLRGTWAPRPDFRTPPLYRWVRHPVYLGFLVALWAVPTMTLDLLLLAGTLTLVVALAIHFEERELVVDFGATYEEYRRRTPMLVPVPQRREAGAHEHAVDRALADLAAQRSALRRSDHTP